MCDSEGSSASVSHALAMLHRALDHLNAADVASLPSSVQAEALQALEGAEAKHTAARARALAMFAAQGGFEDDGHGSAGADADYLILKADRAGAITELDLAATPHSSVALIDQPDEDKVDRRGNALRTDTITDLGYVGGKVIVAGLSNEEFASTLRAIAYPFAGVDKGASIEIWHGAHGQYETNAPIRTFIAYDFDGEPEILTTGCPARWW